MVWQGEVGKIIMENVAGFCSEGRAFQSLALSRRRDWSFVDSIDDGDEPIDGREDVGVEV